MKKRKIAFDLDGVIFWFLIVLVPGAKEFITKLAKEFEILVVTSRGEWLSNLGVLCLKHRGLEFVRVVGNQSKAEVLKREACYAFVDNKRGALKEIRDANVVEHLFWFRLGLGFFRKGLLGVSSVYGWRSLYRAIKAC